MEVPKKADAPRSFHAIRWRLEPLFLALVLPFFVVGAAILYVVVAGLRSGRTGDPTQDSLSLIVTVLFMLFAIGLAWSMYVTLQGFRRTRFGRER